MFELIQKAGPTMVVMLACSVFGLYIVIQKILYLYMNKLTDQLLIERTKNQLITIGKKQTVNALSGREDVMSRVIGIAVKLSDLPREELHEQIKEATYEEIPKLERNMSLLSAIVTGAPLMGLLGTVLGLMKIFTAFAQGTHGHPEPLYAGIGEALINTVGGLSIAVIFLFLYHFISNRIDLYIIRLEKIIFEVLNFCKLNEGVLP